MRQPLLLSIEEEEKVHEYKQLRNSGEGKNFDRSMTAVDRSRAPSKLNAQQFLNNIISGGDLEDGNKKVKRVNTFKIEKLDKFGSGQKTNLMIAYKDEQERFQREIVDMRQREQ